MQVLKLLSSPLEHCHSALLGNGGIAIAALLLAAVALKASRPVLRMHNSHRLTASTRPPPIPQLATGPSEVMQLMARTLLYTQLPLEELRHEVQASLEGLVAKEFIVTRAAAGDDSAALRYEVTPLGRAAFKGTLNTSLAQQAYRTLGHAQQCLVVSSELHLLYLATPPELVPSCKPNWMAYLEMVFTLWLPWQHFTLATVWYY